MKKPSFIITLFSLALLFFSMPVIGQAAGLVPCGGPNEDPCTACDLLVLIQNILQFVLEMAFLLIIVYFVYGGFLFIFSMGKEQNIKTGQQTITNAIIGLIIILTAWIIVNSVFWMIKTIGGKDYTGTWFHIECPDIQLNSSEIPQTEQTEETINFTLGGGEGGGGGGAGALYPDNSQQEESKCKECGKGFWNVCDSKECLSLGNCEYNWSLFGNSCQEKSED